MASFMFLKLIAAIKSASMVTKITIVVVSLVVVGGYSRPNIMPTSTKTTYERA